MQDIEVRLRAALRRKDAPAGLAGRIIARAEGRRRWSTPHWIAVAAAVALMASLAWQYQSERERRLQAENSARQLELALRTVAERLSKVERQVRAPETRVIRLQADGQQENMQ